MVGLLWCLLVGGKAESEKLEFVRMYVCPWRER